MNYSNANRSPKEEIVHDIDTIIERLKDIKLDVIKLPYAQGTY